MPRKTGDTPAGSTIPTPTTADAAVPQRQPRSGRAPAPADPPAVKEASLSPRAKKAAETKAAAAKGAPAKSPHPRRETGPFVHTPKGPDLQADLRAFVTARPAGWGHDDWIAFLDHLRERGHDTTDADAIGLSLERERLAATLERIQGMGPRRVDAMVQRYDTLWSARLAGVDELAALPGMNRSLAEKVRQALS
jgi:hypothetical protein